MHMNFKWAREKNNAYSKKKKFLKYHFLVYFHKIALNKKHDQNKFYLRINIHLYPMINF